MAAASFVQRAYECATPYDEWQIILSMYAVILNIFHEWVVLIEDLQPISAHIVLNSFVKPIAEDVKRLEALMQDAVPYYENQSTLVPCKSFLFTCVCLITNMSNHWVAQADSHAHVFPNTCWEKLLDVNMAVYLMPSTRIT